MRVLIIGCGYVGVALGRELVSRGHEVHGLRRTASEELPEAGIKLVVGDVSEPGGLRGGTDYEWVVNCVSSSGGGVEGYHKTYVEGTKNILEHFRMKSPVKFVYTSSTGVYGQTDGSEVDERSPTEPEAETAKELVAAERLLLDASEEGRFPTIVLRVAGIYGPGRGYWLKQFLRGEARVEGLGERWINMVHRDDVAGTIIAALERGKAAEVYNVVDDEPVTQLAMFKWLAKRFEREMPQGAEVTASGERKRGATNKRVSNRKLKRELGYAFRFPTFREGFGVLARGWEGEKKK